MAGQPYHVTPNGEDWQVKRRGASRPASKHNKKSTAVRKAKAIARRNGVGIVVHRSNGTVQYGIEADNL